MQQVEDSLGVTFGDLNQRQIGPGGGVPSGGDGKDGTEGNGTNVASGGGTGTGGPGSGGSNDGKRDPSKLDPNNLDIAALIREWLAIAEPAKNVEGTNFRYNKWGSWEGKGIGGKTVRVGRPDEAEGMTPVTYVWSIRARLDSMDHCKLEEYVLAKLANKSIDHCHGRYQKSQGIQVANVVGLPGDKAKAILKGLGLKSKLLMGKPAINEAQAFTVAKQDREPSKRVPPGTVVNLTVYDEFKSLIKIPSVAGLPSTAARDRLEAAGFLVDLKRVSKAPKAKNAFTVRDSSPPANTEAVKGSLVVLNAYGAFDDTVVMPKVTGISWRDAEKQLQSLGINAYSKVGEEAPSKDLVDIVTAQSPRQGAKVTPRTNVKLTHYGEYRKTQQQQVAEMKCGVLNSEAYWNQSTGSPGCKCRSGYSAAKDSNSCQRSTHPKVIVPTPHVGSLHACDDPRVSESASWRFHLPKADILTLNFPEKKGLICWNSIRRYRTYAGSKMNNYRCENDWKNCLIEGYHTYKKIDKRGNRTTYHFNEGGYAVRTSKNGAAALATNVAGGGVPIEPVVKDDPTGNLRCLCKGGDALNRNDKTCDSPNSPANVFGGKSDTAYPSGSYPFTNECSYPIKSGAVEGGGSKKLPPDDDAATAKVAARACSNTNLKSGKEWAFPAAIGVSRYYHHGGFLCRESGGAVLKVAGMELIGYRCNDGGWQSCKRNKAYDADLIYPAVDYKWGKRWFWKLKMKWRGYNERELYIEK